MARTLSPHDDIIELADIQLTIKNKFPVLADIIETKYHYEFPFIHPALTNQQHYEFHEILQNVADICSHNYSDGGKFFKLDRTARNIIKRNQSHVDQLFNKYAKNQLFTLSRSIMPSVGVYQTLKLLATDYNLQLLFIIAIYKQIGLDDIIERYLFNDWKPRTKYRDD